MRIDRKVHHRILRQNLTFYILLTAVVSMLAWLSTQHRAQLDLSWNQNNTLTETSQTLLQQIDQPVKIDAYYTSETPDVRSNIDRVLAMYTAFSDQLDIQFIDISTNPARSRDARISNNGEVIITLNDKAEHVFPVDEQNISNALQKLLRNKNHQLTFLAGHDERDLHKHETFHYSQLRKALDERGIRTESLNIATAGEIPEQTEVLIIADPKTTAFSGEIEQILAYLDRGGNLLWLTEPGNENDFNLLAEHLGLELLPGTIVDLNTRLLGIDDPRFALIAEYPPHPITQNFNSLTIFPEARALEIFEGENWDADALLETLPRTWTETDLNPNEELTPDPGSDIQGPLTIGYALSRQISPEADPEEEPENDEDLIEQRVIVVGDADFASNAYLGQAGNLELTLKLVNWLTREEQLLSIPARTAPDTELQLSATMQTVISVSFLILFPLLMSLSGWLIWRKRRYR